MMTVDKMEKALSRTFDINMENVTVTKIDERVGWFTFWGWTEEVQDFINFCKDNAKQRYFEWDCEVFMLKDGMIIYIEVDDPAFYDDVDFDIFDDED